MIMNKCYSMQFLSRYKLDLLLLCVKADWESTKISSRYSWTPIEMLRNSAADTFYGGFTVSKIRALRAVFFPADFWRTNIRRRIRRSAAAEGSSYWCGQWSEWWCNDWRSKFTTEKSQFTFTWQPQASCLHTLPLSPNCTGQDAVMPCWEGNRRSGSPLQQCTCKHCSVKWEAHDQG